MNARATRRNPLSVFLAGLTALLLALTGAGFGGVGASAAPAAREAAGGTMSWNVSDYLAGANVGRANPLPSAYLAPAAFDTTSRISSWGEGSGSVAADGSASLEFAGMSVNFAATGGGWLRLADPAVELDASGNGIVSAIVSYGLVVEGSYPPGKVYVPEQAPVRGPERIPVIALAGNEVPGQIDGDEASWSELAGLWHEDFLDFLAGDAGASPAIAAWAYASVVTNTGDDNRKPGAVSLAVDLEPAPEPTAAAIEVSKTSGFDPYGTETVTVTGEGFDPEGNLGTRPPLAGQPAGVYVVFGRFADRWEPSAGAPSSARTGFATKWVLPQSSYDRMNPSGTDDDYVLMEEDGSFELELPIAVGESENPDYGVYVYAAGGATNAREELAVPIEFDFASIEVSKTSGFDPYGTETVTVTGEDFTTTGNLGTRPPLLDQPAGVYVVFGKFADDWRQSNGAPPSARTVLEQKWVLPQTSYDALNPDGTDDRYVLMEEDGSFELELPIAVGESDNPNYGVYAYAAGGAVNPLEELAVPIEFDFASIEVSKTSGFDPAATETVTVTGENFTTTGNLGAGRPPLAGQPAGVYVVFGKFADEWRPSEGAPGTARTGLATRWVLPQPSYGMLNPTGENEAYALMQADGTFELELPVAVGESDNSNYGVYVYPGGGASNPLEELAVPIEFDVIETEVAVSASPRGTVVEGGDVRLTATVSPAAAGTVVFRSGSRTLATATVGASGSATATWRNAAAGSYEIVARFTPANAEVHAPSTSAPLEYTVSTKAAPRAGSLSWGVKQSFRDYVTGPIAHGSIRVGGGAGAANGVYRFPQTSGGDYDADTRRGSADYRGSVSFSGHDGDLALTLSSPIVRVTSNSTGVLSVVASGSGRVDFATLDLAAGTRTAWDDGAVSYSRVPATLTAAGASAFAGFYGAGEALDPVSFVIGSPATASLAPAVTGASSADEDEWTPPAEPPATEGLEIVGDGEEIVAGGEITVRGEGFEAGEEDIKVVLYSDPVVLATDVTADADGVATWTGRLPVGLTGEHTLTLQGSVDRGIVLDIAAAEIVGCTVEDATLTWGFKESFRAYIDGSIANGEWTVADGAAYETPDFVFAGGEGGYDPEEVAGGSIAFPGSIRFTGHDGALDTTVANPVVTFLDDATAILSLDVTGETQGGETVDSAGVEFVELDLAAAEIARDGAVVTIAGAPAALTAAGEAAFGTYEAGEAFDPVTLVVTLPADCGEAVAEPQETPAETEVEETADAGPDLGWLVWLAVGLVALAIVVAIVVIVLRRRGAGAA